MYGACPQALTKEWARAMDVLNPVVVNLSDVSSAGLSVVGQGGAFKGGDR